MRIALVMAGLALVGGTTVACGGSPDDASKSPSGDASQSASKEEFCRALRAVPIGKDGKVSQDAWDEWLDELKGTGTPKSISDDELEGFETTIDMLGDLDVEADPEDLSNEMEEAEGDLSHDEIENADKFDEYTKETCTGSEGP